MSETYAYARGSWVVIQGTAYTVEAAREIRANRLRFASERRRDLRFRSFGLDRRLNQRTLADCAQLARAIRQAANTCSTRQVA